MENIDKIGILMILVSVAILISGIWLKDYNDKIAMLQVNETGSCYLPDGTCLHATSDSFLYVSFGLAAIIGVIGAYLLLRKKHEIHRPEIKSPEKIHTEPKIPNPENKSIYDLIVQSNGAILQGELVTKSGMDKVKVSRILDKLEMQGLIERRRHGMSNMVVLKKN